MSEEVFPLPKSHRYDFGVPVEVLAKLTIKGKITRTALILLGKEEAEYYLGSFIKIRWNLRTLDNQDKDFEIFSIPLILAVDEVYRKIRNLKYRQLCQPMRKGKRKTIETIMKATRFGINNMTG